jgi:hypothetical protein
MIPPLLRQNDTILFGESFMSNRLFAAAVTWPGVALLCGILLACSTSGGGAFNAPNDRLIVPGERVGPLKLGMTEQDLFKIAVPNTTRPMGKWIFYWYGQLQVIVDESSRTCIVSEDSSYRMANGLKNGSSMHEVQAALGPAGSIKANPFFNNAPIQLYYHSGNLSFDFVRGTTMADRPGNTVQRIGVQLPGAGLL